MITGLTHDEESGVLNKITKYRGKISTGFAPGEGPNNSNHPVPAGFFRILKEQTMMLRDENDKPYPKKEWVLNKEVQKALENSLPTPNETPRRIEVVSLYKTIPEMWESSLAWYTKTDGLMCKSHGVNSNARYLQFGTSGDREWVDREFGGKKGCPFRNCEDFQAGRCKPVGLMKCFPVIDMGPNPYRFETRSINTIMGIESTLDEFGSLLQAAHAVKQIEANDVLPFDGFFGVNFYMIHKKIKSGGRDVFITEIKPTEDFTAQVMEPIKRGLVDKKKQAKMLGAAGTVSLLENAGNKLMEPEEGTEEGVPLSVDEERDIAVNFGTDADAVDTEEKPAETKPAADGNAGNKVAETLLDDMGNTPEK